jgi:gas vesicle protein
MKQRDILAFTLGAIVGTVGAILLAPSSGKNTIDQLVSKIKKEKASNEISNRNLYNLSEISENTDVLERLKAEG